MTQAGIPKWEAELWSHVSTDNGITCPIYESCSIRKIGNWCIADDTESFKQFLSSGRLCRSKLDELGGRNWLVCMAPGGILRKVELLAESYLKMGKVSAAPVPANLILLADRHHPIEVRLVSLVNHHGAIWHLDDSWVIQLKRDDTLAVKRFTLFHEAFHILAHCRAMPIFRKRGSPAGSFNELLADYFAICVLMPRGWVKQKWAQVKNLAKMAAIFQAPRPAVWLRLKSLGLI